MEAAAAEFLEHLAYVARLNSRVNACSDRAIREHARYLSQSLRGGQSATVSRRVDARRTRPDRPTQLLSTGKGHVAADGGMRGEVSGA